MTRSTRAPASSGRAANLYDVVPNTAAPRIYEDQAVAPNGSQVRTVTTVTTTVEQLASGATRKTTRTVAVTTVTPPAAP